MSVLPPHGSIPASAGQPQPVTVDLVKLQVYPRECGAAGPAPARNAWHMGLSPRVRGSQPRHPGDGGAGRSIPASAGQPIPDRRLSPAPWVYPRECGAALSPLVDWTRLTGLSPRVRGSQLVSKARRNQIRSIPASAGQPLLRTARRQGSAVYPRECGAAAGTIPSMSMVAGLSPRVRGSPGACRGA